VFSGASLICALAPAIFVLLAGRALAGFGAALLPPASLAILRVSWPDPAERGRALGVWAGCNGLALAIGPTLGGALIDGFGWRSVFLIVIPLSLSAFAVAPLAVAETADPHERDFDSAAQGFGALALGGLALAAIECHHDAAAAAAAFVLAALAIEAGRDAAALVPLSKFAIGEFRGAVTATAGMTFGMYGMLFLLPLTWLSAGTLGPVAAGVALTPSAAVYVLASPFSGPLAEVSARGS
jgi:MFS family permease